MKVLVADRLSDEGLRCLEKSFELSYRPKLRSEELGEALCGYQVLVVRSTKVSAASIVEAKGLQWILRAGAGTNTIDVAAASRRGIFVSNTPGMNASAVVELTLGMLVALDRQISSADRALKAGVFAKKEFSQARGLRGKRLVLLGFGDIAKTLVAPAQALGLDVAAWSKSLTAERCKPLGVRCCKTLEGALQSADIVSIHLPYCTDTHHLLDQKRLEFLHDDAMVVNLSRGGVVSDAAMLEAVERGVRYASDVFENEPGSAAENFCSALAQHPKVLATPHIGASTEQAQAAVVNAVAVSLQEFERSGVPPECVNMRAHPPLCFRLSLRHKNEVGVLAAVLDILRRSQINVEHIENLVFDGDQAACARIDVSKTPSEQTLQKINDLESVFGLSGIAL